MKTQFEEFVTPLSFYQKFNTSKTNKMKNIYSLLFFVMLFSNLNAQEDLDPIPADFGGEFRLEHTDFMSETKLKDIQSDLFKNIGTLHAQGIIDTNSFSTTSIISNFQWPLRQASGFSYNSYYGISNYVDHNTSTGITDYNCGSVSYDGHRGIDIFSWPFSWDMMDDNQVEVIAGAPGVIVYKTNGNDDKSCPTGMSNDWNSVFVQHSDGSVAWYGHLKTNSLTAKGLGASVSTGEYLGVVGSSGYSTGPHLHLEMYNSSNQLVDPYDGFCDNLNSGITWGSQKPYKEPTLNAMLTHSSPPSANSCYPDQSNKDNDFTAGELVYFGAYYHDQTAGQTSTFQIYQPDNTLWTSWSHASPDSYIASYWLWNYFLPTNPQNGQWRIVGNYQGQSHTHYFNVTGGTGSSPNLSCKSIGNISVNGSTISISNFQVENSGGGVAASSNIGYYLSTNTLISTGDYRIGSDFVASLASGNFSTESITVDVKNVTPSIPAGTYYIGVLIDYLDEVSESSEADNNDCYWNTPTITISNCVDDMVISDNTANNNYKAIQTVETNGFVNVTGSSSFKAGQSVTLNNGFYAHLGCDFVAAIETCSSLQSDLAAESRSQEKANPIINDIEWNVYPNPINIEAVIEYNLPEAGAISISLYDFSGELVQRIIQNKVHIEGKHQRTISSENLNNGMYFLVLESEYQFSTKKIVFLK